MEFMFTMSKEEQEMYVHRTIQEMKKLARRRPEEQKKLLPREIVDLRDPLMAGIDLKYSAEELSKLMDTSREISMSDELRRELEQHGIR